MARFDDEADEASMGGAHEAGRTPLDSVSDFCRLLLQFFGLAPSTVGNGDDDDVEGFFNMPE